MSSIEGKAIIIKQKKDQLKAITLEHEKWEEKISESGKNCDKIQKEFDKFIIIWTLLKEQIATKVEPFFDGTKYPENLKPVNESELLQDAFGNAHEKYHEAIELFEFLDHVKDLTWNAIQESARLLENPYLTLEQIQTLVIPNFDLAKNNYHPSHFDVNSFKEILSSAEKLFVEYTHSINVEILSRKLGEIAVEEEGEAKNNDAGK